MNKLTFALLLTVMVAPLGGCKNLLKKRKESEVASASAAPPPSPPPVATIAPPPATTVAQTPPPPPEDAPTPEDFEDAAFEKITAANFEAELARIKKEVGP
jgi:hypothetical protein